MIEYTLFVGAGLLAMDLETPRLSRNYASPLTTIASKLAPTEDGWSLVALFVTKNAML
jgi:hypothetical protein